MEGRLLSVEEVARYIGVHRDTVYNLIRSGRLPALQLGGRKAGWRITQEDLDVFVQAARDRSASQGNHDDGLAEFERTQAEEMQRFREEQERQRRDFMAQHPGSRQDI